MSENLIVPATAEDLIKLGRTSRIEDITKKKASALFDVDGTLTEPGSELLIATFLRETEIGAKYYRDQLKERFQQWEEARRKGAPNYEKYLEEVGLLWAQMLRMDDSGRRINRHEVIDLADRFFRDVGQNDIQPYSLKLLDMVRELNFNPVLVTGAPMELAVLYAKALGVNHVFAMDAEVNGNLEYTGKMRFRENTGIGKNKAKICELFEMTNRVIGFAMGDTRSDFVLMDYAVNMKFDNDMIGAAALINPSSEVIASFYADSAMLEHKSKGRILVFERGDDADTIVDFARFAMQRQLGKNSMRDGADLRIAA